ncbi:MAG: galactokinase [Spirochaetaceae bacterium]|nr:galactokinase [Spirochaetaceae bacterium]
MEKALEAHKSEYESQPDVLFSAPARIHLLGEHAWYFKDKTISTGVNLPVYLSISQRNDAVINFYFPQLNERKKASIQNLRFRKEDRWANVIKSVLSAFINDKKACLGMDITVYSDILPNAGFGITTAIQAAAAGAFRALFAPSLTDRQLINLIDKGNRTFLNTITYFSDIYTAVFSKKNTCLFINHNNSEIDYLPFDFPNTKIILTDAQVPRISVWNEETLWTPDYACLLGDLKISRNGVIMYDDSDTEINEILSAVKNEDYRRRLLCIIKEQQLVIDAHDALKNGNFAGFARSVNKSHELLRDLFSISCPEIDWIVKRVQENDFLTGRPATACSRITGKGFGRCTYTVINESEIENYKNKLLEYEKIFGFHPSMYEVETADGLTRLM